MFYPILTLAADMSSGLNPLAWIIAWGTIAGVGSMLLYWWASPQTRIAEVNSQAAQARRELQSFDGSDARIVWTLAKRAVGLCLRQIGLVIGPTALAVIPVIVLAWLVDLTFNLSDNLLSFGPAWLPSGQTTFWLPLSLSALAVKLYFRIK